MYGFELSEDDCMKRVYISGFKKDGRGTKGRRSCNAMCSSERATRRKYRGAYITAIDDEEIVTLDQAKEKFAELHTKKVESFTMILAREPEPSKAMMRRAYDEFLRPSLQPATIHNENIVQNTMQKHRLATYIVNACFISFLCACPQ